MELFYADLSPYARKVRVVLHEKGLAGKVKMTAVNPYEIPEALSAANPLSKVPTLVLDSGDALFDSPVICEYLDATAGGTRLLPANGAPRWNVLRRTAIGNGILDAAYNVACELNRRDASERSPKWLEHWLAAIRRAVATLEAEIDDWPDDVDMAAVAAGCALAYLDIRVKDQLDWREHHPRVAAWYASFAQRPSMQATAPRM